MTSTFFWQGYYSFSQKLKHIVRLPFAITAYGMYTCMFPFFWNLKEHNMASVHLIREKGFMYLDPTC